MSESIYTQEQRDIVRVGWDAVRAAIEPIMQSNAADAIAAGITPEHAVNYEITNLVEMAVELAVVQSFAKGEKPRVEVWRKTTEEIYHDAILRHAPKSGA